MRDRTLFFASLFSFVILATSGVSLGAQQKRLHRKLLQSIQITQISIAKNNTEQTSIWT